MEHPLYVRRHSSSSSAGCAMINTTTTHSSSETTKDGSLWSPRKSACAVMPGLDRVTAARLCHRMVGLVECRDPNRLPLWEVAHPRPRWTRFIEQCSSLLNNVA